MNGNSCHGGLVKAACGLALGAWLATAVTSPAVVQTNGAAVSLSVTTNAAGNRSVILQLSPTGTVEVTPYAPDVVRVRFHFAGLYDREEVAISKPFSNWPAFAATFTNQSGTNFVIETGQLQVQLVLSNRFQVHFKDVAGRDLLRDFHLEYDLDYQPINDTNAYAQVTWPNGVTSVSNRPGGFKLKAIKVMPTNESYFGLGDWGGPLNRRGQVLQFWSQDTYAFTESHNPKYTSLPFWYGMQGPSTARAAFAYGVFFNNPARPVVELTSGLGDTYAFHAGDDQLDYFFFGGGAAHTPAAVLDRFSELTGRPAFLPRWAHGYHQSRHSYFTQQDVLDLIADFRASNIPCDAVYLDIGTQGSTNGRSIQLSFDGGNFTNVPGLVASATNDGVQLVPIIEPLLSTNDPLYGEAFTNLYFIKTNSLANYVGENFLGGISWLDFSIAQTRTWWAARVTNYLATYGFESIWNDLNEPNENAMPLDCIWYLDGRYGGGLVTNDSRKWHSNNKNTYNVLQAQVSHQALRTQQPALRPFVLSRSAWPGIQPYAAGWSGDNVSSFDHLRFNTRMAVSVMISGQANYGNDVGGFVNDTTPELLTRWLQAGALAPLYRNHSTLMTANQEPWAFGEPYTLWNRRWIEFRYRMMPHLYTLAQQAATNGRPMNVPVFFDFTDDTNTWGQNEYDFLAGRDLLVAPVTTSGAVTRAVYLPSGTEWYGWATGERYAGGQTVPVLASLGDLPLFVRAGGILPLGPVRQHVGDSVPEFVEVHVWPGGTNDYTLYEDDGRTTNYLAGQWALTPFSASGSGTQLQAVVHARSGAYSPPARDLFLVAHAFSNVVQVLATGAALERRANREELEDEAGAGWAYDTVARVAWVKVADDGAETILQLSASTVTPVAVSFSSSYTNLAAAGTFNYWNEGARNLSLVNDHQWAGVIELGVASNVEFKFVGNDAWSAANWGETNQADLEPPLAQTAEMLGTDIRLTNVTAGLYTFTFNETSLAYGVVSAEAADSDGDGAPDAWERFYGLHPALRTDAGLDLDGDGLANSNEYASGGSPVRGDTDGDGSDDLAEFIAGTSLTNPSSYFAVSGHGLAGPQQATVSWPGVTGRSYEVFFSTNLPWAGAWALLPPHTNLSGSGTLTITDTNPAEGRAYRIGVQRAP
jgi:alpha-glucosidase